MALSSIRRALAKSLRTRILLLTLCAFVAVSVPAYFSFVAIVNAVLNWLFVIELQAGIAGSAWATNISMGCGVLFGLGLFAIALLLFAGTVGVGLVYLALD